MPQQNPILKSFNAGEFGPLMGGRVDTQRYASSVRRMRNFIAAPQGPAIRRSGTLFQAAVADETKFTTLVPFTYSDDQQWMVEFSPGRLRFHNENGILTSLTQAITGVGATGVPFVYTVAATPPAIGDQVLLQGFPAALNFNGKIVNVTNVVGLVVTTDILYPVGVWALVTPTAAIVYKVMTTYTEAQLRKLRHVPSVDVIYLFTGDKPKQLSRFSDLNWTWTDINFIDGPYMPTNTTGTRLTPSTTGNAVPDMTSATLPSGTVTSSGFTATFDAFKAFDNDPESYYLSSVQQTGWVQYQFPAGVVINGYSIQSPHRSTTAFKSTDFAPGTWDFQGSMDGITFVNLDSKNGYVLWDNRRSLYFTFANDVAYPYYRIDIKQSNLDAGAVAPGMGRLLMSSPATRSLNLTASGTTGINNGQGFLATDVGRLIRVKGKDAFWRAVKITARVSATVVTCDLQGEPLDTTVSIGEWRMGLWSDTTGWPTCGSFFEDRLWLAGASGFPDSIAGSVEGAYTTFAPTDGDGTVVDDGGILFVLNARKLSKVNWLSTDERGLLIGTGSSEWVIAKVGNDPALTVRNAKAKNSTARGSASIEPIRIDGQVLYVQRSRRTVRKYTYVYEVDGYKSPSMSLFAAHMGQSRFIKMDFAAEPFAIGWMLREDGQIAGLTHNPDEDVIGWHLQTIAGTDVVVEDTAVMTSLDGLQDVLWMVVRRTVNGATHRYIERLAKFWETGNTLLDSYYADCGAVYNGAPTQTVTGLWWLEGQFVYCLADGSPVAGQNVVNGNITVPLASSKIAIGIGFRSVVETARPEAGAIMGTAQGKMKRTNRVAARLMDSGGGRIGRVNPETGLDQTDAFLTRDTSLGVDTAAPLFSGDIKLDFPDGYDTDGTIVFEQPADVMLPFNLVCLMPELKTEG